MNSGVVKFLLRLGFMICLSIVEVFFVFLVLTRKSCSIKVLLERSLYNVYWFVL